MDDKTIPTDSPGEQPANQGQSQPTPPSYFSQPPTNSQDPSSPRQQPYPYIAQPSQPMNPSFSQPIPPYNVPSYGQPGQPTNPAYPPYGLPNYAPPSQPLYPQATPPGRPPRRGIRAWQWVLIVVGACLVLCCGCGAISLIVNGTNPQALSNQSTVFRTPTSQATRTPRATPTPAATATPRPTATPIPPGIGDHMALGHDYGQNVNSFYIINPADTFSSAQQFAFVVTLDNRVGTTQAKLALVKELSGGAESVEFSVPMNIANPDYSTFANKFATSVLMSSEAPGKYKLQMETDTTVIASATFTYTG